MAYDYLNQRKQDQINQDVEASRSSILVPFLAGIGAIGLGAAIYSTSIAKGGRLVSNLLHFLGHPQGVNVTLDEATNLGRAAAKSNVVGRRSVLNSEINIKKGNLVLGPIDLVKDLESMISALTSSNAQDQVYRLKARATEYINRKTADNATRSYFSHELNRITVDNVLDNRDAFFHLIGQQQWEVIDKAKKLGLVEGSHVLDRGLYFAPSGVVRDTRISSIFTQPVLIKNHADQLIYERVPRFDFFGQGRVVSGMLTHDRGFAVLPGDTIYSGPRYFIDGNIYGYSRDTEHTPIKEILLAKNRKLISSDSPLGHVALARDGKVTLNPKERKGFIGSLIQKFEKKTGVGFSYSDRPSLLESLIIDPIKRLSALVSGKGAVYRHEHKYTSPFTKLTEDYIGAIQPEAVYAKGAVTRVAEGGGHLADLSELSIVDRVKILFNVHDEYSVIHKEAYHRAFKGGAGLNREDLIVKKKNRGIDIPSNSFPDTKFAEKLVDVNRGQINALGQPITSPTAKYLDIEGSRLNNILGTNIASLRTGANYLIHRINSLASASGLGIGFAPAKTFMGNVTRMAAIPFIYEAGKQAIGYADFLLESTTGFSPIKTAGSVYANLRIAQQKAREAVGIQQSARFLEENFPGSVDSEGSFFLRSLAPIPILAALFGKGNIAMPLIAAGTLYAAIGGPSPGQTSEELEKEYSGQTKVAKRKGSMWGLGYLPFFGGEVDYYDYNWYHKLKSDYREKSLYGSKSEYYQYHANVFGAPLPTPHNLFGLKNLLNPYRFDRMHYYDRPYEETGSGLEELPVFGPLAEATIGRILKPKVYRQMNMPLAQAGIVQRGLDLDTAKLLGIPSLNISDPAPSDPSNFLAIMKKQANIAAEPLGVYKFAMEFFGVNLKDDYDSIIKSNVATSIGREFYGRRLGGLFGQTEFTRRFLLSDYNNTGFLANQSNNISNDMPSWMPGRNSEYQRDKDYFIDFGSGDPYVKVEQGESRLPGKGYEALNPLHSNRSGQYDIVDRFLILSDVAPYSQAYKVYLSKVQNMQLDPYWQEKVNNAVKYREESIGVDKRYLRYEDTLTDLNTAIKANGFYRGVRKAYDTFTHDFLAEIPFVGSKLFPFRNPYEQYRKLYVEGSEFASWDRPWEGVLRPTIMDTASVNPIMAAVKGAGIGLLVSGPMSFFNPFKGLTQASPLLGNTNAIVGGGIIGAGLSAGRIALGHSQDFIPAHVKQESDAQFYMDSVTYLKYRGLSDLAASQGNQPLANKLGQVARKTLVGANSPILMRASLPRSADKRFYDYFVNLPEDQRGAVAPGLPGYMQYALSSAWTSTYNNQESADTMAAELTPILPDKDWVGWNPSLNARGTKIALIKHGINGISDNYHRFGFYESQENQLINRIPDMYQDFSYRTNAYTTDRVGLLDSIRTNYADSSSLDIQTFTTANRSHRTARYNPDRSQETINSVRMHYGQ